MKMTFRWYGSDDPVTLDKIRQIPCMTGVVTAVYSVSLGSTIFVMSQTSFVGSGKEK